MARQTRKPDQWIVADGGQEPAQCTMGQTHIHVPIPTGAANFAGNLLNGLAAATGDAIVFFEDDDWYAPTHIESLAVALEHHPIAGCLEQHYYHVSGCWRLMKNAWGASLGGTAIRRDLVPTIEVVIRKCLAEGKFYIDYELWRSVPPGQWGLVPSTVVGIKGLPGTAGLGIGHRPGAGWNQGVKLRELIGDDSTFYVYNPLPSVSNPVRGVSA